MTITALTLQVMEYKRAISNVMGKQGVIEVYYILEDVVPVHSLAG